MRDFWEIASEVCTAKELEALAYQEAGYGKRKTAKILGISPTTVRDRLEAARRKIQAEDKRRKTAA